MKTLQEAAVRSSEQIKVYKKRVKELTVSARAAQDGAQAELTTLEEAVALREAAVQEAARAKIEAEAKRAADKLTAEREAKAAQLARINASRGSGWDMVRQNTSSFKTLVDMERGAAQDSIA